MGNVNVKRDINLIYRVLIVRNVINIKMNVYFPVQVIQWLMKRVDFVSMSITINWI